MDTCTRMGKEKDVVGKKDLNFTLFISSHLIEMAICTPE